MTRIAFRYALGLLSCKEEEEFEEHLLDCESCRADVQNVSIRLPLLVEQPTMLPGGWALKDPLDFALTWRKLN